MGSSLESARQRLISNSEEGELVLNNTLDLVNTPSVFGHGKNA